MIVARNKIFNGNDFTIYWDDHVFSSLFFSLPLCLPLIYGCVILKMRRKKPIFQDGIKFPLGTLWWKYLDTWQVGWREKQQRRVKLLFIQNEQNLEKGKNKGEGERRGESEGRAIQLQAGTIFCKNKWRTFKEHENLTSMLC